VTETLILGALVKWVSMDLFFEMTYDQETQKTYNEVLDAILEEYDQYGGTTTRDETYVRIWTEATEAWDARQDMNEVKEIFAKYGIPEQHGGRSVDPPRDGLSMDEDAARDEKPSKDEEDHPELGRQDDEDSLLAAAVCEELAFQDDCEEATTDRLDREPSTWHDWDNSEGSKSEDRVCSCTPARAICWEQSYQTWQEHINRCEKCRQWTFHQCEIHGKANLLLAKEYERVSKSKGTRFCNEVMGHVKGCICYHFPALSDPRHSALHWSLCYDKGCVRHHQGKQQHNWIPREPRILAKPMYECPTGKEGCECAYDNYHHPYHSYLKDRHCKVPECRDHKRGYTPLTRNDWRDYFLGRWEYYELHREEVQLAATNGPAAIVILGELKGQTAKILLDSGASENFIREAFLKQHGIKTTATGRLSTVRGIDGNILYQGPVRKTEPILLKSGDYEKKISFREAPLRGGFYDAVLGLEWLKDDNPLIYWDTGRVISQRKQLQTTITTGCGDRLDYAHEAEGSNEASKTETNKIVQQTIERLEAGKKYRVKGKSLREYLDERNEVRRKLPEKYHEFMELFVKRERKLPSHPDEYRARIPLIPGAELPQVKQRQKSRDELKLDTEFIQKFLEAGFIREG
jgi:hypothetical protein